MEKLLTFCAVLTALCSPVSATTYFQTRSELITKATAIAIIELHDSEPAKPDPKADKADPFAEGAQGNTWNYTTQAKATVISAIQGKIPKDFVMYGGESFICAQTTLAKGKYLAFLVKDKDYWVGANWHLSLRPIKEDQVEWYVSEEQRSPMKFQALDQVIREIKTILSESKSGGKGE